MRGTLLTFGGSEDGNIMSYRIMTEGEHVDETYYRASCSCFSPECDVSMQLSTWAEEISLSLQMNVAYDSWRRWSYNDSFIQKVRIFINRWKVRLFGIFMLLFTGRLSMEGDFLFENPRQIYEWLDALEKGALFIDKEGRIRVPFTISQLRDLETLLASIEYDEKDSLEYRQDMMDIHHRVDTYLQRARTMLSQGLEKVIEQDQKL